MTGPSSWAGISSDYWVSEGRNTEKQAGKMLIAGDVGGTKTALALYAPGSSPHEPLIQRTYQSREFSGLTELLKRFLADTRCSDARQASIGVAGPIVGDRVSGTNLPWTINGRQVADSLGFESVWLLNDLVALANAVPALRAQDLIQLKAGNSRPHGAIGVIAPGTGLGEAFLTHNGRHYVAYPSEGGHSDFGPNTDLEVELLTFLRQRYDHVSYERVCSGTGLPNLYEFLKRKGLKEPVSLRKALAEAEDPTPIIVEHAQQDPPVELCLKAVEMMVRILGAEAGNLAMRVVATGGIYLGGGMPPHLLPFLQTSLFVEAFCSKGRLTYLLDPIPVYVILNPKAALLGAAAYGLQTLSEV